MLIALTSNLMFMLFSSFAAYHDFCAGRNGWGIAWCVSASFAAFSISFGIEEMIERVLKRDKEAENGQRTETN